MIIFVRMEANGINIHFDGQEHCIDANTLINTLTHYQNILNVINAEYGGGAKELKVKINAIEKGSFAISLSLVENVFKTIFSADGIAYVSGVVTIFAEIIRLYKERKGHPVRQDDNITINIDNSVRETVINTYNYALVREAISKSMETANEDVNVDGIDICAGKENISIRKEEFADLIYTDFDKEAIPQRKDTDVDATLVITGLHFEPGRKWDFLWNGMRISIIVKDDALMKAINAGERFGKGDAIRVKMRINQEYQEEYGAYANKSYRILQVYEHIAAKGAKDTPML